MYEKFHLPPKTGVSHPSAVSAVETTIAFLSGDIGLLICAGFAQIRRVFLFEILFLFSIRVDEEM